MIGDPTVRYLSAYPPGWRAQVRVLIEQGRLLDILQRRYPERHDIISDGALYDYVGSLKSRHLRSAGPLAKAVYDSRLHRCGFKTFTSWFSPSTSKGRKLRPAKPAGRA